MDQVKFMEDSLYSFKEYFVSFNTQAANVWPDISVGFLEFF